MRTMLPVVNFSVGAVGVRALADAVCGELGQQQREYMIDLLHTTLGYMSAMWEPVATACTQLAATVHPSGDENAA